MEKNTHNKATKYIWFKNCSTEKKEDKTRKTKKQEVKNHQKKGNHKKQKCKTARPHRRTGAGAPGKASGQPPIDLACARTKETKRFRNWTVTKAYIRFVCVQFFPRHPDSFNESERTHLNGSEHVQTRAKTSHQLATHAKASKKKRLWEHAFTIMSSVSSDNGTATTTTQPTEEMTQLERPSNGMRAQVTSW